MNHEEDYIITGFNLMVYIIFSIFALIAIILKKTAKKWFKESSFFFIISIAIVFIFSFATNVYKFFKPAPSTSTAEGISTTTNIDENIFIIIFKEFFNNSFSCFLTAIGIIAIFSIVSKINFLHHINNIFNTIIIILLACNVLLFLNSKVHSKPLKERFSGGKDFIRIASISFIILILGFITACFIFFTNFAIKHNKIFINIIFWFIITLLVFPINVLILIKNYKLGSMLVPLLKGIINNPLPRWISKFFFNRGE